MISLNLLVITISGIAAVGAIPNNDLENLVRIKRGSNRVLHHIGDNNPFIYNYTDSASTLLIPALFKPVNEHHHTKFSITRDLGYTSWDEFFANYHDASAYESIGIQFYRNDKQGETFDTTVGSPVFTLKDIRTTYENVEAVTTPTTYFDPSSRAGSPRVIVRWSEDRPFSVYSRNIFDETIKVGSSRVSVKIDMALEGYKKDDELILQVAYRIKPSYLLTTSGMYVRVGPADKLMIW